MPGENDVLVIGGGIVGVACAYELACRGRKVVLIDRDRPGHGCSYGNAGWLTPCFALPLPMPGMMCKALGWLMNPDSPLYIQFRPSWLLLRWLTRFAMCMNHRTMKRSVAALTALSSLSLQRYLEYQRTFASDFHLSRRGLLMVAQTDEGMAAARQEMNLVAEHGIPGSALSPEAIRSMEPALVGTLVGGVYFPDEADCEPLLAVEAMLRAAEQRGVTVIPRAEVFDVEHERGVVRSVHTTRGVMRADNYVLATGSWSAAIAKRLRLRVPILGGKGYALICDNFTNPPAHPIMLLEKKIAVTPRRGSVRLAGTLELVNQDFSITPRRVRAILRGAGEFLQMPEEPAVSEVWRGLRPCTPDGLPMIGRLPRYRNLFIAAGHQMLGLQSAPGTATLLADLVTGGDPTFDPTPFQPDRF